MRELSPTAAVWIAGTFAILIGAIALTARWVPITFS